MNVYKTIAKKFATNPKFITRAVVNAPITSNLDYNYLCDPNNIKEISDNVIHRKGVGDIQLVQKLYNDLQCITSYESTEYKKIQESLYQNALRLPNRTHPIVSTYDNEPKVLKHIGQKRDYASKPLQFHDIGKRLHLLRTEQLGILCGSRSYYFLGELAELENALIRYTVGNLIKENFTVLSVPDILNRNVIESCGLNTRAERTQVYSLDETNHGPDLCLSGTSEMAIAGYYSNKIIPLNQLPKKIAAVSRCFRAETSSLAEERGIYRVHQFTKVEMFALTTPQTSDAVLEELLDFEERNFSALGLHLRTLDMPAHDLGAPAYRKYDVEAWLPGKEMFGEVSSCSNCTDYQSRRLNIRFEDSSSKIDFVHTLNGTACAIPRMLIALIETFQNDNGTVEIPTALSKFMNEKKLISKQKNIPQLKLLKNKK